MVSNGGFTRPNLPPRVALILIPRLNISTSDRFDFIGSIPKPYPLFLNDKNISLVTRRVGSKLQTNTKTRL